MDPNFAHAVFVPNLAQSPIIGWSIDWSILLLLFSFLFWKTILHLVLGFVLYGKGFLRTATGYI